MGTDLLFSRAPLFIVLLHQFNSSPTEQIFFNMKSIAAVAILASSAAAFVPANVARVESSLSYAKELDSMFGKTVETGGRVVSTSSLFSIMG